MPYTRMRYRHKRNSYDFQVGSHTMQNQQNQRGSANQPTIEQQFFSQQNEGRLLNMIAQTMQKNQGVRLVSLALSLINYYRTLLISMPSF